MSNYDDETLAAKYAASLSRVQSNTIAVLLAQYYANTGDFNRAFDILDRGAEYTRANAEQWQKMLSSGEAIVDRSEAVRGRAHQRRYLYQACCKLL